MWLSESSGPHYWMVFNRWTPLIISGLLRASRSNSGRNQAKLPDKNRTLLVENIERRLTGLQGTLDRPAIEIAGYSRERQLIRLWLKRIHTSHAD